MKIKLNLINKLSLVCIAIVAIFIVSSCDEDTSSPQQDGSGINKMISSLPSSSSDFIDTLAFTVIGIHSSGGDSVLNVPNVFYQIDDAAGEVHVGISLITKDFGLQKYKFVFLVSNPGGSGKGQYCHAAGCHQCPNVSTSQGNEGGSTSSSCGSCIVGALTDCGLSSGNNGGLRDQIANYASVGINAIDLTGLNVPTKLYQLSF